MPRAAAAQKPAEAAEVITAAVVPVDDEYDESLEDKSMEDWLRENGARRNARGNWYRMVPDPSAPVRRVVDQGEVYEEIDWIRRPVAVAESWDAALQVAKASNGQMDALIPGVGWVRGGRKIEREHPDNVGTVAKAGPKKTTRTKAAPDNAEAERALALKPVLDAYSRRDSGAAAPPAPEE